MPTVEEESRSMGVGSPTVGPPLPTDRLPTAATAPNELVGTPRLVAAEVEGCQSQLEPPFPPFPLCLPLERPGVRGKGLSEPLPPAEEDWVALVESDVFWALT